MVLGEIENYEKWIPLKYHWKMYTPKNVSILPGEIEKGKNILEKRKVYQFFKNLLSIFVLSPIS